MLKQKEDLDFIMGIFVRSLVNKFKLELENFIFVEKGVKGMQGQGILLCIIQFCFVE